MRLLQFPYSPYAAKVRMCLAAKKLTCDLVDVPYLDRGEVVKLTGGVMVPVLVDGAEVIADSPRIVAWLDEKYSPSLRAGAFGSLGVVIEQWADGPFEDAAFRLACPGLEQRVGGADPGREKEARAMFRLIKERRYGSGCIDAWRRDEAKLSAQVVELLAPIAQAVKARPFILGDAFSLADAAVGGQLHMVEAALPGWVASKVPALSEWYGRVRVDR